MVPLFSKILIPSRLHSLLPSLHPSFPHHRYLVVRDCKSNTFSFPNQMFSQVFYLHHSNSLVLTEKFFIASSLFFSSNWGFLAIFGRIRCRFAGVLNGVVDIFCQTFFYFRGIITSLLFNHRLCFAYCDTIYHNAPLLYLLRVLFLLYKNSRLATWIADYFIVYKSRFCCSFARTYCF